MKFGRFKQRKFIELDTLDIAFKQNLIFPTEDIQ